ncbi:MAG: hypothetical protein WCH61_07995, partial [bacterium]
MRWRTGDAHRLPELLRQLRIFFPLGHDVRQLPRIADESGDTALETKFNRNVFLRHDASETVQQQWTSTENC